MRGAPSARIWCWWWLIWLVSCTPRAASMLPEPVVVDTDEPTSERPLEVDEPEPGDAESGPESGPGNPIPVGRDDGIWGPKEALVTMVWFADLQDPFCQRVLPTLQRLLEDYGSDLRIVVKHYPLPFHKLAKPAAKAAVAVRDKGDDAKFVRFIHLTYERRRRFQSEVDLTVWADEVGIDVRGAFEDARYDEHVERDIALAKKLGVSGVPGFRINGVSLSGAQPYERFVEVIDAEIQKTRDLRKRGVSLRDIYDQRVEANFEKPPVAAARAAPDEDKTVYQVPVGNSPVDGPADALVTMIEFAGYQCPFCGRVQPTLDALGKKYKGDLRIVFKHNPLPFHKNSAPAAKVAIEVYQKLGQAAFWTFTKELFSHQKNLGESELYRLGAGAGLSRAQVKAALGSKAHERAIYIDQDLANDFGARGTPYFFINGVRLSGAQPKAKFESAIDRELAKARALVKAGIPRAKVYAEIMKTAKPAPPPAKKPVPPVQPFQPRLGSPQAPVSLYLFADLQCPFCARLFPTLIALEHKYKGNLQIIWYDLPLPFHTKAPRNANAAHEVKRQLGDPAFWKFVEELFKNRSIAQGADPGIVKLARGQGINGLELQNAIGSQRHQAQIAYGEKVAQALGISGTPASLINGYYLSGAQPERSFERLIDRALKDHRAGHKPTKLDPAKLK